MKDNKKGYYKLLSGCTALIILLYLLLLKGECYICSANTEGKSPKIAVVIDDFGNNSEGTDDMLNLGIPITAAVMPFLPTSSQDAEKAHKKGHGVILHLPMEPEKGKASWLGPRGITVNLPDEEIENRVEDAVKELKYVHGINNHTGSKAMKDERVVKAVLRVAKRNNLLFLDSKTTDKSKASQVCSELGITYLERDLFLDHQNNTVHIEKQLDKAGETAIKKGYAIVIGHVGPAGGKTTVRALKNKINSLKDKGIEFVTLKEIEER
ncbi:divergent polysaccharide deacetylase family protein [Clostridium polynesiense]|uniref:divergent polysaccharide deacetylase family protein n=1 Tax=Clostridium polynesiense TaxID=1325933 RepID=UPI0006933869|nr:divergent polysaccharide deacetylase family protein [Clostridium polynesiense]